MIGDVKRYDLECGTVVEVEELGEYQPGQGPSLMVRFNHGSVSFRKGEGLRDQEGSPLMWFSKDEQRTNGVLGFVILGKSMAGLKQIVEDWEEERGEG